MPFKRILCPVDFSNSSLAAFETAIEMTRRDRAELCVLHVIEGLPVVSEWFPAQSLGEAMVRMEEKAHQAVNTLLASSSSELASLAVATTIVNGVPFVEILKQTKTWNADLIVLGARGATSMDQIMFGSTAERVLRGAACSVLVVRKGAVSGTSPGDQVSY